jgi:AbrB family looped-hinge helix DNA binding protein
MEMVMRYGMSEIFALIDKTGRIVLPKQIRDELALNPGDVLVVSIHGPEVTLRLQKGSPGLADMGRALVFSAGNDLVLRSETVEQIIAQERNRSLNGIAAGLKGRKCRGR